MQNMQNRKTAFVKMCGKIFGKSFRRIFCLPLLPTMLISIPSYILVIYALTGENVNPVTAYVSYFLSAYALILTVTGIVRSTKQLKQMQI